MRLVNIDNIKWRHTGHGVPCIYKEDVDNLPIININVGKWIHCNDDKNDWLECSNCRYGSEGEVKYGEETNYCPNCGLIMEVSQ